MTTIAIEALTPEAFAPFGDVLQATGDPAKIINQGNCGRWHDLAALDFADGRAGISLFNANARALPYTLDMVERHPDGSQCFLPMTEHPWLVIVAAGLGCCHGLVVIAVGLTPCHGLVVIAVSRSRRRRHRLVIVAVGRRTHARSLQLRSSD